MKGETKRASGGTANRRDLRLGRTWGVVTVLALSIGCQDDEADMIRQPRYDMYEVGSFFADEASVRPLVPGTIPRGTPLDGDDPWPEDDRARPEMTGALLRRGRERFDIFCSMCHGRDGYGEGMVVRRGFPAPASFHEARLRQVPDEHVYNVITHGLGTMPPHGGMVRPRDRWAIIAYLRALQFSQHAPLTDLSDLDRERLAREDANESANEEVDHADDGD